MTPTQEASIELAVLSSKQKTRRHGLRILKLAKGEYSVVLEPGELFLDIALTNREDNYPVTYFKWWGLKLNLLQVKKPADKYRISNIIWKGFLPLFPSFSR